MFYDAIKMKDETMKKIFKILTAIAAFASISSFAETLKVGTEGVYPPWNYYDEAGKLTGFEIDMIDEIAKITGHDVEYITLDFDALIPNLKAGRLDFFLSGMTINKDRLRSISFSDAYMEIPNAFVTKDSSLKDVQSYDDILKALKGKSVGAQTGTVHGIWAEDVLGNTIDLRLYRSSEELAADVSASRVDVGFAERTVWENYLKNHQDAFFMFGPELSSKDDPDLFGQGIGIGIKKGDAKTKEMLDAALQQLRENGKLKELAIKYYGFDASR